MGEISKGTYEAKLEFLVGWVKPKSHLWWGVWIFSGTTQLGLKSKILECKHVILRARVEFNFNLLIFLMADRRQCSRDHK